MTNLKDAMERAITLKRWDTPGGFEPAYSIAQQDCIVLFDEIVRIRIELSTYKERDKQWQD